MDCEWAGRPYDRDFKLLCLAMTPSCDSLVDGHPDLTSPPSNEAWVWTQEALQNKECVALLKEWLRDPKHKKIGSYFKSDTVALHAALGVWTRGVVFDTRLLRKLMDAEASGKLADMAHLVGRGGHKDELSDAKAKAVSEYKKAMAKGSGGLFRVPLPGLAEKSHADKILAGADQDCYGFAFVNPELLYRYNAADTVVTALVGSLLEHWLAKEPKGMQHVAREVVIPAGDAYARVESWGLRVDKPALEAVGQYLDLKIAEAANRFREYGYNPENPKASTFSPGSPQQVARLLFVDLGLKSTQTTESGAASTGAEALEELADQHPVVNDILSWRGLSKMKATYVDGTLGYIRDDGRIHPTIHPDGARTGRTSSSNPNMQNAPSVESNDPQQAELARMYRDCFAPPAGHSLLEVDYSQLELRVAADLSGDPAMLDIFKQGQDYHLRTAQMLSKTLWNITPEEVTDTHRREVKACIAEGSLVLTNNGLKEIEAVALDDLLWDGVEWVSHSGVIFQGVKEVIEYDGLIATPDHVVFTTCGREIGLSLAAKEGCRLAVTAIADHRLGHAATNRDAVCGEVPLAHRHDVYGVPSEKDRKRGQCAGWENQNLSLHVSPASDEIGRALAIRSEGKSVSGPLFGNSPADDKSRVHCVSALRSAGHSEQVCQHSRVCGVLPATLVACDIQGTTDRQDQQRWSLRAGESAAGEGNAKSQEYLTESVLRVQGPESNLCRSVASAQDGLSQFRIVRVSDDDTGAPGRACREHSYAGAPKALGQKRVYDILNAGPRNRFTVSGKLVHNCNFALLYDDSPHGIAYRIGITPDKAEEIRDAVFGCFPMLARWIQERVRETVKTGAAWTWWAGAPSRRRPLVEIANIETQIGKTHRRASWNMPIQGTGNEYLVASAIQVVDWLLGDGVPAKLLVTIHDSMLIEVRNDAMSEVRDRVLEIMTSHPTKNGVPLMADAKCGPTWARMVKWKAGQPCPLEGCR